MRGVNAYHIENNMQTIILFHHSPLVGYSVCFQALQGIRRQQKYRVYFIAESFFFFLNAAKRDNSFYGLFLFSFLSISHF